MSRLSEIISGVESLDERISGRLRIHDTGSAKFRIAAVLAHSGDSWFWCVALFCFWLFSSGEREKTLAYWGGSIALTALLVFFLKRLIARTRPEGNWGGIYRKTDPYSFPSGHAVRAGLILSLAFDTFNEPLILMLFCCWAVLMILSRVATGVHYFFDILGGFLFGILLGWVWILAKPWIFSVFPILFDKSRWFHRPA